MGANSLGDILLNQFRVDAFVASGGMGAVYRVWDLKRNVPLAMKVLHSELAEDPVVFKRFQREANALKKLAHPNIVPFYGLYQSQDFAFLLERFVDGPSLKEILRQSHGQPLQVSEALAYMKALCAALGYAHANGVVHCDVKPGNVMVDRGGNIYLTDFGIARHAESTTTTMGAAGTPAYMAPEQILGKVVTPATDVYALGVVLFEMLTGGRPFRGTEGGTEKGGITANERIRYGHLHLAPPDPRSLNPNMSAELSGVVLKALSKQHQQRFQSTQEFFVAICVAAGRSGGGMIADRVAFPADEEKKVLPPINAGNLPPLEPLPKNRFPAYLVGGSVVLVVLCVIAVLVFIILISRSNATPTQTNQSNPDLQSPSSAPITGVTILPTQAVVPSPTFTPIQVFTPTTPAMQSFTGGEWVAYAFGPEQNKRDLYEMKWQTGEKKQITTGGHGDNGPSFSPDGRAFVFYRCETGDCQIVMHDENGPEKTLIGTKSMWPSWCKNPSKPWVIYENRDDGGKINIWMIDLNSQKSVRLTNGEDDRGPDWSPDCSRFSFLRGTSIIPGTTNKTDDIFLFDMNTRTEQQLTYTPQDDDWTARWSLDGNWLVYNRLKDSDGNGFINTDKDKSDLMIIRANGSGSQVLTQGQYRPYSASFSPDGSKILFGNYLGSSKMQLVIYDLRQKSFKIIADNGSYYHPVWGP
jgi:serine/threonine protein kinase